MTTQSISRNDVPLQRCHICHQVPEAIVSDNLNVTLTCFLHPGHMAIGADYAMAAEHWNRFITFMSKQVA